MRRASLEAHRGDMNTSTSSTKLTRSRDNRVLGGVCAGLARRVGWKPRTMRIAAIASCILPGPQFLAYLALWIVMPADDRGRDADETRTRR